MDQHAIRPHLRQHVAHAREHRARDVRDVLIRRHHVQVELRVQLEQLQHRVEHLAVLSRHADAMLHAIGGGQRAGHRRHLHRLRPCAEHRQDLQI